MQSRLWIFGLALLGACGGPSAPHPPPEGEWLEWTPSAKPKPKQPLDEEELGDSPKTVGKTPTDASGSAVSKKPSGVSCSGKDNVRDSICVAKSDLGADCPASLPSGKGGTRAGTLESAPDDARREASLESGPSLCCYAWCVKVPAAGPDKCKKGEDRAPLFCFEAPAAGTTHGAPAPYPECPAGLKKSAKKGRRLGHPSAAFSKAQTNDARADAPKACCYEACSKSK